MKNSNRGTEITDRPPCVPVLVRETYVCGSGSMIACIKCIDRSTDAPLMPSSSGLAAGPLSMSYLLHLSRILFEPEGVLQAWIGSTYCSVLCSSSTASPTIQYTAWCTATPLGFRTYYIRVSQRVTSTQSGTAVIHKLFRHTDIPRGREKKGSEVHESLSFLPSFFFRAHCK